MSSIVTDITERFAAVRLAPQNSEEVSKESSLFDGKRILNSETSSFVEHQLKDNTTTTLSASELPKNKTSGFGGFSPFKFQVSGSGDAPLPPKRPFQNRQRIGFKNDPSRQQKITLSETLYVPVKKYPKYNFVGRILGPRGMTVKQLEKETGCKIYVRGRASNMAFNPHTKMLRGGVICNKSSLSTISQGSLTDEPLHVAIECHDYPNEVEKKMENAVAIIKDLLSPPADGKDELKRQQLVDISLINGTYRPTNASNTDRPRQTVDPTSNPVVEDVATKKTGVYRIPQRRNWCKPRGQDVTTEEFAQSASSREYVMDIVNQTTQETRVVDSQDLSQTAVAERLKIASSLLDSHQKFSYGVDLEENQKPLQVLAPLQIPQHTYDHRILDNSGYYSHPPPPPPPMAQFMHHYSSPPPPLPYFPPPPTTTNQSAVYPVPGLVYMLPDTFDNNNDYEKPLHHHHRRY